MTLGLAMFFGRFLMIIPIAGDRRLARAKKKVAPRRPGTFPTHGPLFVVLCSSA